MEQDVQIENCGSIMLFQPLTAEAREWLEANADGMWWGSALVVEPRYAVDLADGMMDDGLMVA